MPVFRDTAGLAAICPVCGAPAEHAAAAEADALRPLAKHGAAAAHLNGAGLFTHHTGNLWQCREQRCIDARNTAWTPEERAAKEAIEGAKPK
jgi:hypothetical protein